MKFFWLLIGAVAAICVKENLCVPAISPLTQHGILFPEDNWDDCFLDEANNRPGLCKRLEECPEVLKKWDADNIYPKTCYFIRRKQFVCCPIDASKEVFTSTQKPNKFNANSPTSTNKPDNTLFDIFNVNQGIFATKPQNKEVVISTKKPSNIFLGNQGILTTKPQNKDVFISTKKPSNIFLDNIKTSTTTTVATKRPSNIFLANLIATTSTTKKSTFILPDIFNTEKPLFVKRRSETECDLQNQQKFETIDVNGPSSEPTEFPFMAALGWTSISNNKIWYPCGGILISPKFVLTSAHCAELGGKNPSFVYFGDKGLTDSEVDNLKIKQFIIHPSYNATTFSNDIALVELQQEVNNPIACLWTQHDLPITKLTALGYGQTGFDSFSSNQLLQASLTAIDKLECQEYYRADEKFKSLHIEDAHLCAGDGMNIQNSCQGDTGGPLIMELQNVFYVVGVTTFGLGCADLPPSIYTRVSSFIDWMEPIVWPEIDVRFDRK